ncbi:hypothetical protein [Roseimaritima ulvae]|uniref:hypothetical protein n=1 Tax=Roseimaritima ulvae TaxID=980254 RepID=UPI0011CE5251|nr:hypothetical protein [Roseimaritima ulvae]
MAKRFVIASTIFSSPAVAYAAEDAPRLQVAEQRLILVEPTNGKPVVAAKPAAEKTPAAAEARVARLPDRSAETPRGPEALPSKPLDSAPAPVDDGWVARDHIGQRTPLRDPVAITAPRRATDTPDVETAKPKPAEQQTTEQQTTDPLPAADDSLSLAEPPASQPAPALGSEQAEAPERKTSSALQGLTPVPLMDMVPSQADEEEDLQELPLQGSQPPQQKAVKVDRAFDHLAPRRERTIPVRRPDLTRDLESQAAAGPMEQNEASGQSEQYAGDARTSLSPSAEATDPASGRRDRPKQLSDLFREPAAHNEGDGPSDLSASDDDQQTAGNSGYVGDFEEQDWQRDHQPPEAKVAPQKVPLVITPAVQRMRAPMEAALVYHFQRPEKAPERSSWGMMHSLMVYGVETQVIAGRKRYNLVAWMAGNNICRGQRIFTVDRQGIAPRSGVGLQGHQGQFLAVFGLIGVPESYPLYVGKRKFAVADLVAREQADCRSGAELTFTLIGLSHYLDTDAEWTSSDGQRWDFERLIQEELDQQVIGAACGGTHRLMGLSHALRIRREQGRPISGQWARAEQFISDFVDYAWKLQNPDGSMSTDWFEGRANRNDLDRKVQTTGHIVEWLIGVMPDEQLQDPRMVRAIGFLTNALYRNRSKEWEIGPKGHALRSLALYHDRVYGDPPPWRGLAVARGAAGGHQRRSR